MKTQVFTPEGDIDLSIDFPPKEDNILQKRFSSINEESNELSTHRMLKKEEAKKEENSIKSASSFERESCAQEDKPIDFMSTMHDALSHFQLGFHT